MHRKRRNSCSHDENGYKRKNLGAFLFFVPKKARVCSRKKRDCLSACLSEDRPSLSRQVQQKLGKTFNEKPTVALSFRKRFQERLSISFEARQPLTDALDYKHSCTAARSVSFFFLSPCAANCLKWQKRHDRSRE